MWDGIDHMISRCSEATLRGVFWGVIQKLKLRSQREITAFPFTNGWKLLEERDKWW